MDPYFCIQNSHDLKSFISAIGTYISYSNNIKLNNHYKSEILKIVCQLLNVKSSFELNDRLDGVNFLKRISKEVLGLVALTRLIENQYIDINKLEITKNFKAVYFFNNYKIRIITTEWGEFPLIDLKINCPIVFLFRKDELLFSVFGFASLSNINEYQKNLKNIHSPIKGKFIFSDFSKVSFFKTKEDLLALLNRVP